MINQIMIIVLTLVLIFFIVLNYLSMQNASMNTAPGNCTQTTYGCCPDGINSKVNTQGTNCPNYKKAALAATATPYRRNPPGTGYNPPGRGYGNPPGTGYNPPGTGYNPPGRGYNPPGNAGYGNPPGRGYNPPGNAGYGNPPGRGYNPPGRGY